MSELRQTGDRAKMFQVSAALAQTTLAVSGLVACLVLMVNQGFVTWWVGRDQFAGVGLTLLMLAAMLTRHFNTTNVYALFCFGHERRLALTALADGVVTIGAGLALRRGVRDGWGAVGGYRRRARRQRAAEPARAVG